MPGHGNACEVDMRGDVFVSHIRQRISIDLMRAVAQHRAHAALRVVILMLGKAVVNHENRTCLQLVCQGAYKALGLRMNFSDVIMRASHFKRRP